MDRASESPGSGSTPVAMHELLVAQAQDAIEIVGALSAETARSAPGGRAQLVQTERLLKKMLAAMAADGQRGVTTQANLSVNPTATVEAQAGDTISGRRVVLADCPRPPGAVKRHQRSVAFSYANPFCMGLLYGRAGCFTALFGGFRPGQCRRTSLGTKVRASAEGVPFLSSASSIFLFARGSVWRLYEGRCAIRCCP